MNSDPNVVSVFALAWMMEETIGRDLISASFDPYDMDPIPTKGCCLLLLPMVWD